MAQLRDARMLGRRNERCIEAESLLCRTRYQRLDAFLAERRQAIRVAPDSVCGFVLDKAGVTRCGCRRSIPKRRKHRRR